MGAGELIDLAWYAQAINLGLVIQVLNSTKSTDIPSIVASLGPAEQVSRLSHALGAQAGLGHGGAARSRRSRCCLA